MAAATLVGVDPNMSESVDVPVGTSTSERPFFGSSGCGQVPLFDGRVLADITVELITADVDKRRREIANNIVDFDVREKALKKEIGANKIRVGNKNAVRR